MKEQMDGLILRQCPWQVRENAQRLSFLIPIRLTGQRGAHACSILFFPLSSFRLVLGDDTECPRSQQIAAVMEKRHKEAPSGTWLGSAVP